jgi:hypothetical protein
VTSLLAAAGCGSGNVVPPAQAARHALETALTAWKDGKPPQSLADGSPVIHAVDNDWVSGRKLTGFEITGEKPSGADKRFSTTLELEKPAAKVETTYVVIGTTPISVFRQEDYERTLAMDNNPTITTKKKRGGK